MGSGASRGPAVGVAANPRVVYNDKLSKTEKQTTVMDAPVLVDIQHGSVRYRYGSYEGEPADKTQRTEKPFESTDVQSKQHYFYHTRLKDFGQGADRSKEDEFKFLYVTKGPARALQKKLFYVYGKGFKAKDGTPVKPTQTKEQGNDYSWPRLRLSNHLYYNLVFTAFGTYTPASTTEECTRDELKSMPDKSNFRFTLTKDERTRELKAKIAAKFFKAASDIHVCVGKLELRDEDVVGEYQEENNTEREDFEVELQLI